MAAILGGLPAFALDLEGLTKNSPFGGTGAATGPGAAPSTLEFRGMYREEGINYYSIYNTLTKQSSWVAEGEAASTNVPVVVKGFDAVNETLTVDNGGQPQQMALHQAVVVTYKGPSPAQLAAVSAAVAAQAAEAAPFVNRRDPARALGPDGLPARSRRAPKWADVPNQKWDDWRWQLSNRVNDLDEIAEILELTDDERDGLALAGVLPDDVSEIIGMQDAVDHLTTRFEMQAYAAMGGQLH